MIAQELEGAGPLDGLLLASHGAGVSQIHRDMDGWWLGEIRKIVGPNLPIIATLDPHANVTPAMLKATNALLPYQTNPHLDLRQRCQKAAQLMVQTLRGEIRPVQRFCAPPMFINIEKQHTQTPPLSLIYELCKQAEARPKILDVSVILGYQYANVPAMSSGITVVADGDVELAQQTALALGAELWRRRAQFLPDLLRPEQAIIEAKQSARPVCLLDMGDNIGGGSTGEGTWLLHLLDAEPDLKSFVCVYDPGAVQRAWRRCPVWRIFSTRWPPRITISIVMRRRTSIRRCATFWRGPRVPPMRPWWRNRTLPAAR